MIWLVAGLGNPGESFANNRHNVGAMVVEEIARRHGARFRRQRFVPVDVAEIKVTPTVEASHAGDVERVLLARSHRFMNESGPSYASIAKKNAVAPDHVIAVHDELDIASGALRVKLGGSTAGHNGLNSLTDGLRTPEFYRVRVGIGRPPGRQDPADFVLQNFPAREEADVSALVDDAADAVLALISEGLEATQERFNRSAPRA